MKQNFRKIPILIGLLILATLTLQACSFTNASADATIASGDQAIETTSSTKEPTAVEEVIDAIDENTVILQNSGSETQSNNTLTTEEIDSLIFMREEEKLARDVYLALYDLWGLNIFENIANSEQTHMDAVKHLLDTFNIPDPADTSPAGMFENYDLQNLYNDLIEVGSQSLGDALKVGAAIEEIDILDLEEALLVVENSEISEVYGNLLKGSENHLRAFTSTLEKQTGEIYTPQYLSDEAYDAIITAESNRGPQENVKQGQNQQDNSQQGSSGRGKQNRP